MQDAIVYDADAKFEFNSDVSVCFEDMLKRSIPNYAAMRKHSFDIGKRFVKPKTNIVDIGCSNGLAIRPYLDKFCLENKYILIDDSEAMLTQCKQNFKTFIDFGAIKAIAHDITQGIDIHNTSVILAILTVQFTPLEYRQSIIKNLYENLIEGGALIFVEKVIGSSLVADNMLVETYYEHKEQEGYSINQIMSKKKALSGVLVPLTAKWNQELLTNAGFSSVEMFWRSLNFCGWVAIR
jgi:tRNA (cmo5U34)-methyltransferase